MRGQRIRRPVIISILALRGLRGEWKRSAALIVSLSILTALLVFLGVVETGVDVAVRNGLNGIGADILVTSDVVDAVMQFLKLAMYEQEAIFITPPKRVHLNVSSVIDMLKRVEGVGLIAPQLYVGEYDVGMVKTYSIFAIDVNRDFTVLRWFDGDLKEALRNGHSLIGSEVPIESGKIEFQGNELYISGRLKRSGTGLDESIIISLDTAYGLRFDDHLPHYRMGQATSFLITVEGGYTAEDVARSIRDQIAGVLTVTSSAIVRVVKDAISGTLLYLSLITTSVLLMSIVLTSAVLSMVVNERRGQIGLLRALGMRNSEAVMMVVLEALVLGLIAGAFGSVMGLLIVQMNAPSTSLLLGLPNFGVDPMTVAAAIGRSVLITAGSATFAAIYPGLLATRIDPYAAIRGG
ncbi:MAG: FtsX-like permease family protein [Aigarchaeota archaeon]|nr:FtsX-like permease family protein [Aigarchaeota archaeon]MDW8092071.1 FtsX-like permease family protein [Nitrososphaerota archaeon]